MVLKPGRSSIANQSINRKDIHRLAGRSIQQQAQAELIQQDYKV